MPGTGDLISPSFLPKVILNCSALPCLLHLLSSPKESIRKEACWTISNITAGNRAQIQVQSSPVCLQSSQIPSSALRICSFFTVTLRDWIGSHLLFCSHLQICCCQSELKKWEWKLGMAAAHGLNPTDWIIGIRGDTAPISPSSIPLKILPGSFS